MKKATLENYSNDIKALVITANMITDYICGFKRLPDSIGYPITWKRINHCQAWYFEYEFDGVPVTFIRSYNTIVAFLYQGMLYSIGRYSMTTYQHIRKFRNNYTRDSYNTPEKNLGLVDWF